MSWVTLFFHLVGLFCWAGYQVRAGGGVRVEGERGLRGVSAGREVRLSTGAPSPRRLSFRARVAQFARASPRHYYTLDSRLESIIMLIGLVRDSVMQCFCHSCRAPVLPAGWKRLFFRPAFYDELNTGVADTTIAAETNLLTIQFSYNNRGRTWYV